MSEAAQLQVFAAAVLCIAIFLTSFAAATFNYRNHLREAECMFFISAALLVLNLIVTMHTLATAFTMIVGSAGWILAFMVARIHEAPIKSGETPASVVPPAAG